MNLTVIDAQFEHLPDLARLNKTIQHWHAEQEPLRYKSTPVEALKEQWAKWLMEKGIYTKVALADGQVVGYIGLKEVWADADVFQHQRDYLYVNSIAVEEAYQQKGVGKALMEAAKDVARSLGKPQIRLDTWQWNETAIRFFHEQGFQTTTLQMSFRY